MSGEEKTSGCEVGFQNTPRSDFDRRAELGVRFAERLVVQADLYHNHKETMANAVHIYVRWQLRNRRYAAFVYAGALRAMGRCVQIPLTPDDLVAYRPEAPKRDLFARFAGVVDGFVIPLPKAAIPEDVGKEEFPNWIGKAVREQEQKGTGALKAEWMETAGSFLAIFAVLLRTWFDP